MKIGLVDVDGHNFPNLCLMKISAYHKSKGDNVSWAGSLEWYDKVYMAKVFDFTPDDYQSYQTRELIRGGTGYSLINRLPCEIENVFPDYSIYEIKDIAYGYLTRGCPRGCEFCIVGQKEGLKSYKVANLSQFWNGQKYIKLLDPNLLACSDWKEIMQQLVDSRVKVDFTQGLDIRLMTQSKQDMLNNMRIEVIHFAWDNFPDDNTYKMLKKYRPGFHFRGRQLKVYVLTNFNTTHTQDLERIYRLRDLDYDPYIMIYNKYNAPKETRYLQRWVNNKQIFRTIEKFEDYDHRIG